MMDRDDVKPSTLQVAILATFIIPDLKCAKFFANVSLAMRAVAGNSFGLGIWPPQPISPRRREPWCR